MSSNAKRILIVDDEPAARAQLRDGIESISGLQVVREVDNGKSAIEAIIELSPDIVFLDIDMPEVDGLAVARATEHIPYQLVFLTAHHQYALEAFDTHAIDYLLKPARPTLIEKCLAKIMRQEVVTLGKRSSEVMSSTLVLSDSGTERVIKLNHLLYIEGLGRYRRIHLSNDGIVVHNTETFLSDTTLDDFTVQLEESSFMRVHRSYLVNLPMVTSLKTVGRQYAISLLGSEASIPVARARVKDLKAALAGSSSEGI